MPIYEYRCEGCGHELEVIQKMSEAVLRDCPECGEPQLKKLVSAAGFQLKGTGWYATDFKDNGKGKDNSKGKGKDNGKGKQKSEAPAKSEPKTGGGGCAH